MWQWYKKLRRLDLVGGQEIEAHAKWRNLLFEWLNGYKSVICNSMEMKS